MEKVNKVIPISLGMVKVFAIKGRKHILIDAGLPGSTGRILEGLRKNAIDPKDISLIVITHNHTDHSGGLHALKELTGAKVAVHRSEAEAMQRGETTEVKAMGPIGRLAVKLVRRPPYKGVEADILVDDELDLSEYGVGGRVIHTPGHTPGSLTIFLQDGEAIVGDLLNGRRTKEGCSATMPFFATSISEFENSLIKVAELAPSEIHNSHGKVTDVQAVKGLIAKLRAKKE